MIKIILNKYNIKPKKSLWQNFLINDIVLQSIVDYINIKWENVIEIWPGYWALTEKLLVKKPNSLTLVEVDKSMIQIIEDRIGNWDLDIKWVDFKVENNDVLKFIPVFEKYLVIANIPYYITSPILRHFLYEIDEKPKKMLILMQEDVWKKILWKGKNKSSVLNLIVSKKCYINEVIKVSKDNFFPVPKVESSILYFEIHNLFNDIDDKLFLNFIKKCFAEPRKTLLKNLVKAKYERNIIIVVFDELSIIKEIRAEDLWIHTFIELFNKFH